MSFKRDVLTGIGRVGVYMWGIFCIAVVTFTLGIFIVGSVRGFLSYW